MKKKLLSLLLLVCVALSAFAGCEQLFGGNSADSDHSASGDSSSSSSSSQSSSGITDPDEDFVEQDYASSVTLDMTSETQKLEVNVKLYIDGDTTHFYLPSGANVDRTVDGVLKARYLAVDTPESTGKIEKWGKQASNFTKEKLKGAESIIIETDGATWEVDSTGGRHLVWVWYKPAGADNYRNLNIELLQQGFAIASNSAQNRYGTTCMAAIAQAKTMKLHVHSPKNTVDPLFYEGEAVEMDLKELRLNIADYDGISVAFEGVITRNYDLGVYVESYDAATDVWYGMYVYYGNGVSGYLARILSVGNKVRIVGKVQYWEGGDSYQVSGLTYNPLKPNSPTNTQLVDPDNKYDPANVETTVDKFYSKVEVEIPVEDENGETIDTKIEQIDYAKLGLYGSISMKDLKIKSIYVTQSGDSKGAMTFTCEVDGKTIEVRTEVLIENGEIVTKDRFENKTIDVTGVIDCFNGSYQIRVFNLGDITVH